MKGTVPTWLEPLLGLNAAESGEGTAWRLEYAWPLSPSFTLLAAVAVAALIVTLYLREAGTASRARRLLLAVLRLSALALLCVMIAQVSLSLERTGLPALVFVVDDSESMGIVDHYNDAELASLADRIARSAGFTEASRLNLAKSLLLSGDAAPFDGATRRHKLRLYFVSDAARSQAGDAPELAERVRAIEPTGGATRLGQGLRAVLNDLRGTPPAAIVLLSDGINTDGESLDAAAALARHKGVPLFTVALGNDRPSRDLQVSDLLVDDVVFVDDVVNFEFKVTAHGFAGRQVEAVLREKSSPTPLARATVTLEPDGEAQRVRIPYRPTEVGEFEYIVEINPLTDEAQEDNNRQQRMVSVRKGQIRVLFAQAYPSYEFRYLKHLLERDTTVELSTVLQEADTGYPEIDRTALRSFPVRRDELFSYDVVIFGDVNPTFLGPGVMKNLSDFVTEKGGGLIVISGPRFTPASYAHSPLAALLPLEFDGAAPGTPLGGRSEGFHVAPTELGMASPTMQLGDTVEETRQIWANLPPLYWMFDIPRLKPAVRVLAEHPARSGADGAKLPLICLQYVGAGKVLFHAVDGTWRWRYRVGDVFFARYWVQTIRYLSRSKLLGKDNAAELVTDRREYQRGEPVKLRVRFTDDRLAPPQDDGVNVVLEQEGGKNQHVMLRRLSAARSVFEASLSDLAEGRYHAWVSSPSLPGGAPAADFLVARPAGEFERVETDTAALARCSAETKGRSFTLVDADELIAALPAGRQVPIEALKPIEFWNRPPLILCFLGLLIGEWLLRKRSAMV